MPFFRPESRYNRPLEQLLTNLRLHLLFTVLVCLMLTSCAAPIQVATPTHLPLPQATPSPANTPTQVLPPTGTSPPPSIWMDPELPKQITGTIILPDQFVSAADSGAAVVSLGLEGEHLLGYWTLAPATRFDSLREELNPDELQALWQGEQSSKEEPLQLYLSRPTLLLLTAAWGAPAGDLVNLIPADSGPLDYVDQPGFLTILPFDELSPRLKVLALNGQKPLWPEHQPANDPLSIPVYLTGDPQSVLAVLEANPSWGNLKRDQLTSLAMTGVTAMVRATAWTMEQEGILYPARQIQPIFNRADLTHISNEVPFDKNCPTPVIDQPDLYFCSADSYLELLEYVGTDIVELSGDHFGDRGPEAMLHTLSLYKDQGWYTYGGGKNLQAGLQPVKFSHHGNQFAFIGCNAKGGKYAGAAEGKPGAAECDFDWMESEISQLARMGYLVIATMQHDEYYSFQANYLQIRDFRRLAKAGAAVVSGSQAHQPQTMEFHAGAFIHYGLGNLFFDQYRVAKYVDQFQDANKAFIDLHYFYQNRHLSTELYPIKFVDYAQSRPMTAQEREALLENVFNAQPR
jgi:poly-gamma-glutamate synthesis protein (capsule biosynthesis protein)